MAAGLFAFAPAASATASAPATVSVPDTSVRSAASVTGTGIRPAADLSQFRAGNIISDAVFTDAGTLNGDQIQTFLQGKVSACRSGYVCLKDFRQNTPSKSADRYCNGYSGASNETAGSIIAKVARSCGINPQVIVVMLQKEQGLVTDTWPIDRQYAAAMGQACPDTAPCDPSYAGFFAQVYGGARQMKIYLEGVYFTWYAPGHTWNILYNPNQGCGSSPVYIENAATSALYYYTPYQPNAAALNAGYGTGDGCSAYGNRNFFNYFNDWFGSTQKSSAAASLVAVTGRNQVFLIMGGTKYHVATSLGLDALAARLGSFRWVSGSVADALPTGPDISRYVHDPRTGTLYLLDPDGSKHRLPDAGTVAAYGYAFGSFVNIPAAVADAYPTGAEVGTVFTAYGSSDVYQLSGTSKRHIWDQAALTAVFAGRSPYIATMEPTAAAALTEGATAFAPNTLVRAASAADVYLTTATATIVHIPSFALAADFGATRFAIVPDAALARSVRADADLGPLVRCEGAALIWDGGRLRPVSGNELGGVQAATLTKAECASLPARSTMPTLSAPLLVQDPDGAVYYLDRGTARHVLQYADLVALNGARSLQIAQWTAAGIQAVGIGADYPGDAGGCGTAQTQVSFSDVPNGYPFHTEIMSVASRGLMPGFDVTCGTGEFRVHASVSRADMAGFLYRAAGSPAFSAPATSPFTDVSVNSPSYKEITWLASTGVSTGWTTATGRQFRGGEDVSREAMAAFLYRYAGSPAWTTPAKNPFIDVTAGGNDFSKEISWLADAGITKGWATANGAEFRPTENVARDAMAAFLYRYLTKFPR